MALPSEVLSYIPLLTPPPVPAEHISHLHRMTSQSKKEHLELVLAQELRHLCFPQGLDGFQKDKVVCMMGQYRTTSQEVWEMENVRVPLRGYPVPVWEDRQTEDSTPAEFLPRFSPLAFIPPLEGCWGRNRDHGFRPPQLVSLACPMVSLEKAPKSGF